MTVENNATQTAGDQASDSTDAREFYETMEPTPPMPPSQIDEVLSGFLDKLQSIAQSYSMIKALHERDQFRFLSKNTRNNILGNLQDDVNALEEITKITVKSLKKVKRVRIAEDELEELLGVPTGMRGAPVEDKLEE